MKSYRLGRWVLALGIAWGLSAPVVLAQNPVNDAAVKGEMYIWNRATDFWDLVSGPWHRDRLKKESTDFVAGVVAKDPSRDDQTPDPTFVRKPARQLGRGVSNVLVGIWEVPFNIHRVNQDMGGVAACTYGLVRGVWRFGVRELTGVVEIVTFPFGWDAIIEPEFPFEPSPSIDWRVNEVPFLSQE